MTDEEQQRLERLRKAVENTPHDVYFSSGSQLLMCADLEWAVAQLDRLEKAETVYEERGEFAGITTWESPEEALSGVPLGTVSTVVTLEPVLYEDVFFVVRDAKGTVHRFQYEDEAEAFVAAERAKEAK